jgi:hypothetical protein
MSNGVLDNKPTGPDVIEGSFRAPFDGDFPENELPLHLENTTVVTRRWM